MQQPVRVITGQAYGQAQAAENAQRAIPLPNAAAPAASAPSAPPQPGPPAVPGQQDFTRPTERPGEPVTAGLPTGPGPGPEALGITAQPQLDQLGQQLRMLYQAAPNNDLLRLIELHDHGY